MEVIMIPFKDLVWGVFYSLVILGLLLLIIGFTYGYLLKSNNIKIIINMTLVKFLAYTICFVLVVFYDPAHNRTIFQIPWIFHIPNQISLANLFVAILSLLEAVDNLIKFIQRENPILQSVGSSIKQEQ